MLPKTYVILVITLVPVLVSTELHSLCKLSNGEDGNCQLFINCKSAKKQILFGIVPIMCDIEFVCCENEKDIERSVESEEVEASFSRQTRRKLISQSCYSGQTAENLSDDTNTLMFSTITSDLTDKENLEDENNFLVKIGVRKANGDLHFFCGGILIKPKFILTAAHCTDYRGQAPEIVQISTSNTNVYNENMEIIPISKIHSHPDYSKLTMYNDIALLELAVLSSHMPICMRALNAKDIGKVITFALGHDLRNGNAIQSTTVDIMSSEYCNEVYTNIHKIPQGVLDSQFCVGNSNITEAAMCKHFIGGPLLAKETTGEFYLIGLANYVHMCHSTIYPMIYTKIAAYKQWLESVLNYDIYVIK